MMSWREFFKTNNKGFTLIELIVVMAILAILAALVVPNFTGISKSSKDQADAINKKMIETAVQMCYEAGDLESLTVNTKSDDLMPTLCNKGYLKEEVVKLPSDPKHKYTVHVTHDGTKITKIEFGSTEIEGDDT